jgi:hypothetical protein
MQVSACGGRDRGPRVALHSLEVAEAQVRHGGFLRVVPLDRLVGADAGHHVRENAQASPAARVAALRNRPMRTCRVVAKQAVEGGRGQQVDTITSFLDPSLLTRFGLPRTLRG